MLEKEISDADTRLELMRRDLMELRKWKEEGEDRIRNLSSMVDARDKEISRLGNLYIGGETVDKMNLNFVSTENSKTISKLET
jgi:hypothetical protein